VQAANPLANLEDIKDIEECKLRVAEVDLLGNFHDEVLDNHTQLAWERTGEGYEISWNGPLLNEFVEVAKVDDDGWAFRYKKGRRTDFEKKFPSAEAALKEAEGWLKKVQPTQWALGQKNYKDGSDPATPDQKRAVQAFGLRTNVDALTKGEARLILSHHYSKRRRYTPGV
jgi:hypothetical protein